MYNHAPVEYHCPFCSIASQQTDHSIETTLDDIILATEHATAFISSRWWPNNPGHVIVIPNHHYENIYDLPIEAATAIHVLAREVAIAMKTAYLCQGISTRQHNEPAGNQDVWHYHLHIFPRYQDDQLYLSQRRQTTPEERHPYAVRLRALFHNKQE